MTSFADKLQNKKNESTTITYKCDKCGECKQRYFIHLDQGKGAKYICSYLCSNEMHIDYGKDYWDSVVNTEDFNYPKPPIYGKRYKHEFGIQRDIINSHRNDLVQELYNEDLRVEELERDLGESSDSEYYSE
tara:strand:+ start:193 stop:588 length:396 start_codon:yes stop_codon:yes gene_type:complete